MKINNRNNKTEFPFAEIPFYHSYHLSECILFKIKIVKTSIHSSVASNSSSFEKL